MKSVSYCEKSLSLAKTQKGTIQEEQIIPFKERLKGIIGDQSIREFSRNSGVSDTTLRDYLRGKSYPTLDRLCAISDGANVDLAWLATGEVRHLTATPVVSSNHVEVFQYDFSASAGHGCLVISEDPVAKFELSKEWLIKQGLYGKKLTVVPVCGDSMEPTLIDEDLMLVVLIDDHKEARDGVCVIRIDDEVMVKRIQYDFMERGYHIKSDNDSYQSFFVGPEYQDRFSIIGRMARVLQRAKR